MTTSTNEPRVKSLRTTEGGLSVDLVDGRTVIAPLGWFPRLAYATVRERNNWRLIGQGSGIHWPDLDEDVSVAGLLAGRPSGESQVSFKRWLSARKRTSGAARRVYKASKRAKTEQQTRQLV